MTNKITPLTERLFCLRSGSAADTQQIADYVRYYLDVAALEMGRCRTSPTDPATGSKVCVGLPSVKTAAGLFKDLCYSNKKYLSAGIIVGGWDPEGGSAEGEGTGSVYSINIGGTLLKQPFALGGSGSTYVYGWCDSNYRPGMTKDECLEFVRHALALAMARDGSSGGVIRTVVVDKNGNQRDMIPFDKLPKFWMG